MTDPIAPPFSADVEFALAHVPATSQRAMTSLWTLDATLGNIVATTTQPLVGQLRLTWWHEALSVLGTNTVKGEPVLDALANDVIAGGRIETAAIARLVEGWEALLEPMPLERGVLEAYADHRGAMFDLSAVILGAPSDRDAGRGWALSEFALRCSDDVTAGRAWDLADLALANARMSALPRSLRSLARLAEADCARRARAARSLWRRLRSLR